MTVYAAGYMAVAAAALSLFAPTLISWFDPTPQVMALGSDCLRVVAWSEVASAVGVVLARSFDGAGNTVPAMAVNLISLWGLEVSLAFGLSRWLGLGVTGVWWGRPSPICQMVSCLYGGSGAVNGSSGRSKR